MVPIAREDNDWDAVRKEYSRIMVAWTCWMKKKGGRKSSLLFAFVILVLKILCEQCIRSNAKLINNTYLTCLLIVLLYYCIALVSIDLFYSYVLVFV